MTARMKSEPYIYGIRPVIEALKAGKEIDKILIQKGLRGEGFHQLFSFIKDFGIPSQFVPSEKLQRITRQNHQGVIAYISEISYQKLEYIIPYVYEQGKVPLVLVLDRITDVRNFGAIARTAECAGVDALVIPAKNSATVSPDAIKTSAGALYKLSVCRSVSLVDSLHYLKNSGLKIVAATEKTETGYTEKGFGKPMALVIGSEEDGISDELLNIADEKVRIPVLGEIASLNVSVATGIILYEIIRQRNQD
jgi:23S rRNA (guanosine2251-2'-O)-methyltransferase